MAQKKGPLTDPRYVKALDDVPLARARSASTP